MFSLNIRNNLRFEAFGGLIHIKLGRRSLQVQPWCGLADLRQWDWFFERLSATERRAIIGPFELCSHRTA